MMDGICDEDEFRDPETGRLDIVGITQRVADSINRV